MQNYEKELGDIIKKLKKSIGGGSLDNFFSDEVVLQDEPIALCVSLIDKLCEGIKSEIDIEDILYKVDKKFRTRIFWNHICEEAEYQAQLYLQCNELRSMDEKVRNELLEKLFAEGVLVRDSMEYLAEISKTDRKTVEVCMELFKEAKVHIIDQYISKRAFSLIFENLYGLGDATCDTIWRLFNENKQELMMRSILTRLVEQEQMDDELDEDFDEDGYFPV